MIAKLAIVNAILNAILWAIGCFIAYRIGWEDGTKRK